MKLAIVTTHPVQYNAPWFRLLSLEKMIAIKVFYTWEQAEKGSQFDPGFGRIIQWDIPLLDGYEYKFVKNTAAEPGSHHFKGIVTPDLNAEIENWGADSVLIFGWSFAGHLKCLRHFKGKIPVLFRGDSTLLDEGAGLKRTIRKLFLTWVYRNVDIALYVGTNNKAYFKKYGLKDHQLVFCPHAIDNSRFMDSDGSFAKGALEWRRALGYREDDRLVVFAGKFEPKKNPRILLDLARSLQDSNVKFLLVGNGEMENELKQLAADLRNVQIIDFQNQGRMPLVYRLADVFILPSQGPGETWGLALNEAMASSVAIVASDKVGAAIDLIRPGENGYIFQSGKVDELLNIILKMVDGNELREMGRRSGAIIKDWSFDQLVKSLTKACTSLRQPANS